MTEHETGRREGGVEFEATVAKKEVRRDQPGTTGSRGTGDERIHLLGPEPAHSPTSQPRSDQAAPIKNTKRRTCGQR